MRFAVFDVLGRVRAADQWLGQAIRAGHVVEAEAPFDAQVAAIDGAVEAAVDTVEQSILDVQVDLAADAAVGAGGLDNAIGLNHVILHGTALTG